MGAGLAGGLLCLPQSVPHGGWVSWGTSLSTNHSQVLMRTGLAGGLLGLPQSGPHGWWVSHTPLHCGSGRAFVG